MHPLYFIVDGQCEIMVGYNRKQSQKQSSNSTLSRVVSTRYISQQPFPYLIHNPR